MGRVSGRDAGGLGRVDATAVSRIHARIAVSRVARLHESGRHPLPAREGTVQRGFPLVLGRAVQPIPGTFKAPIETKRG